MQLIDRNRLAALIEAGAVVLDVLPAPAYRKSHIRGARSFPLKDFSSSSLAPLGRATPIAVYCNDFT